LKNQTNPKGNTMHSTENLIFLKKIKKELKLLIIFLRKKLDQKLLERKTLMVFFIIMENKL